MLIGELLAAEILLAQGWVAADLVSEISNSEQAYSRWRPESVAVKSLYRIAVPLAWGRQISVGKLFCDRRSGPL